MFYIPKVGSKKNVAEKAPSLNKELIFTYCSGRSGTNTVSDVFKEVGCVHARHEPKPTFSSKLPQAKRNASAAFKFWVDEKIHQINDVDSNFYMESSHMVSKAFLSPLLEMGVVPYLIFISRNPSEVAKSFYEIGSIPGRSKLGNEFMISPNDPSLLVVSDIESLTDYQTCFWYALEIEMRINTFKSFYDRSGFGGYYVKFEEMCPELFFDVMSNLGIPESEINKERIKNIMNTPRNDKKSLKEKLGVADFSEDEQASQEQGVIDQIIFGKNDAVSHLEDRFGRSFKQ